MYLTSAIFSLQGSTQDLDRHYTPINYANQMVELCELADVDSVADFAAGSGNLLLAAQRRWPATHVYANDIDVSAILTARGRLKNFSCHAGDFLSGEFHNALSGSSQREFSLILLNPPFTGRGEVPGGIFSGLRCSRAMAFVLASLDYLREDGELLAILPTATLTSAVDEQARKVLSQHFKSRVAQSPSYGRFEGVDVSTYVLKVTRRPCIEGVRSFTFSRSVSSGWSVGRGKISMNRADRVVSSSRGWVHTTSIESGSIRDRYQFPADSRTAPTCLPGSLLLPRVGKFGPGKIVLLEDEQSETVSDCLFSVSNEDRTELRRLKSRIIENFPLFRKFYGGSGAPYLTVEGLQQFIAGHELSNHDN